ncbi:MAG: hemolysin family protein [Candidatus Krumholzibacteria bacterium]|nr:hemolysin family protein [Candidatus Krumholzibacteria bacterium]
MIAESRMIALLVLLVAAQFMVAGGFAAFGIVSRQHVDKVFPRRMRGSLCPRFLHRGRFHLMLSLIGLEAIILSLVTPVFQSVVGEPQMRQYTLISVLAIAVGLIAVTIAGFGAASMNPVRFALVASYPLLPVYLLLRPPVRLFLRMVALVFPDLPREMARPFFLFPGADGLAGEGFIEEKGSKLIRSVQEFGVKKVREIMVPRIDIFALDVHTPHEEIREKVASAGHSRFPVCDGSIDRIVGLLYVKDLLKIPPDETIRLDRGRLVREAYFVPEGKKLDDLLREFQRGKKHMAVVVDEYGGTSGIVTLEDILEEIVGEILDEYDHELPPVRQTGARQYVAAGSVGIDTLNAALSLSLPSDEVDTLGGFLYNLIGRVPEEGEEVEFAGMRFRINRLEGQRIIEVIVWLPEE